MIWVGGRIVPDEALSVSVLDRAFEHGLGLFETLRTWSGHATLLDRHLARMRRSAEQLGLPIGSVPMPDAHAVAELLSANRVEGDALLRITLSGGMTELRGATLWMRSAPLPPPTRDGGAVISLGGWEVLRDDPLARHKTLNYWSRRAAYEAARARGFDESLGLGPDGSCWEGSRTNLFVVKEGVVATPNYTSDILGGINRMSVIQLMRDLGSTVEKDQVLTTPSREGPLVPGILRALVLEHAPGHALRVREPAALTAQALRTADEVFLTNSVRGIIPVARLVDVSGGRLDALWHGSAPGPRTRRLWAELSDWLHRGGEAP